MSTNKQGKKLYSLVGGWNRVVTVLSLMSRHARPIAKMSRQIGRRRLWERAFAAVNKADIKRCNNYGEIPQNRKERRSLARAYFIGAILDTKRKLALDNAR